MVQANTHPIPTLVRDDRLRGKNIDTISAFSTLIHELTGAIIRNDAAAACACFTETGAYHDVFYGSFNGAAIETLVNQRFHRDGQNFRWDIHDPVDDGRVGYARYVFSYDSTLEAFKGQRVVFEGVAICQLKGELIDQYREVADAAPGLLQLGFNDERLAKFIRREATALLARPESARHLSSADN